MIQIMISKPKFVTKFILKWMTEHGEEYEILSNPALKNKDKDMVEYIIESDEEEEDEFIEDDAFTKMK